MAFRAQYVQSPGLRHPRSQLDVGAAPRHVRCNGDCPALARARYDLRFLLVILRVQHRMDQPLLLKHPRQHLARFHRDRAHQRRPALYGQFLDFLHHRVELFAPRFIHRIIRVLPDVWPVGRYRHHPQLVNIEKLGRLRFGRARHARQLLVEAEIILDRDRCQSLRFPLDRHAFLRLHCLMQSVTPAAARHQAAGVLVHNDDLVFLEHVFHVELVQAVRLQQL